MTDSQIINFLMRNSEFFTTNALFVSMMREFGWMLAKQLALLLDTCIRLYDWTFGMIDITKWGVLETYLQEYKPLLTALMMLSLVILGFMYMFGKNKKHNLLTSILIFAVVATASSSLFQQMNLWTVTFKDAALGNGSSVNGYDLLRTNLFDLYYIDSKEGLTNLNHLGHVPQYASLDKEDVNFIDMSETLDYKTEGLSEDARSILKKRMVFRGDDYSTLKDVYDGAAWTSFGNTFYYRYHFRYGSYFLSVLAAILIYICLAYKNVRIIYDIFVSRILLTLHSADMSSTKKGVKIIESIRDSYFALCFTAITLKSYFLFVEYVNSMNGINGLGRGIILLFVAFCAIDGANIMEKLTGTDAGLTSMTGKMIAAYHMMRGATQTVQQARQFHMMKQQRDAMRSVKTAASAKNRMENHAGQEGKNSAFHHMDDAVRGGDREMGTMSGAHSDSMEYSEHENSEAYTDSMENMKQEDNGNVSGDMIYENVMNETDGAFPETSEGAGTNREPAESGVGKADREHGNMFERWNRKTSETGGLKDGQKAGQRESRKPIQETGQRESRKPMQETGQKESRKPMQETGQRESRKPMQETGQRESRKPMQETGQKESRKPMPKQNGKKERE